MCYLKPIFHCDVTPEFALPNAKYTNMLVYFALGDAHFFAFHPTRNLKVAFLPNGKPKRKPVEFFFFFFFDSMFISVEDRTGRIRFSYNYSMNFTCSQ